MAAPKRRQRRFRAYRLSAGGHRNETNLGFAAANNQGYAHASGDVIIFLNSDVAGDAAWLKLVADDVKDGALYGPSLAQQFVGGRWLPYLEGWCIAATRATWERLRWHEEGWQSISGPMGRRCLPRPILGR
jgi:glycosyltransferase involved in cell wall biosynthesis